MMVEKQMYSHLPRPKNEPIMFTSRRLQTAHGANNLIPGEPGDRQDL